MIYTTLSNIHLWYSHLNIFQYLQGGPKSVQTAIPDVDAARRTPKASFPTVIFCNYCFNYYTTLIILSLL